ncbi:MAG: hypothetical protein K2X47_01605 [Bdellovibrionales bacterium]|nr:hypothetical protein [Bdellovibrionales bacterium]
MYQLMARYYENHTEEQFQKDLFEKDDVILLKDRRSGYLQGFSTLVHRQIKTTGQTVYGVFSGDTVIEQDYWNGTALGKVFLKYLALAKIKHPFTPLYWFLISKGYKTYLMMANNFAEYAPRFDKPTPAHFQDLMNAFYRERFGDHYDARSGLIRFEGATCKLKINVAAVTPDLMSNPRIRFFSEKNPNWDRGDELACVAKMTFLMPLKYGIKAIKKGLSK